MKNGIDRRRDPRAPLTLPVYLKTTQGTIEGKTANISVSGLALILFFEKSSVGDEFQISVTLSDYHEAKLTCAKRWSGDMVVDGTVYNAVGVRITKISPEDREIIASLVQKYYLG